MTDQDNRQPALSAALRALKDADETLGPSPTVEERLRGEVASLARSQPSGLFRSYGWPLAVAASLTLVVASSIVWMGRIDAPKVARQEVVTDFVPLQYASVPAQSMQIVRLEVSRSALSSMGLASFDAPNPNAATVLADVMIGEDGLARAVRFVRVLSHQE